MPWLEKGWWFHNMMNAEFYSMDLNAKLDALQSEFNNLKINCDIIRNMIHKSIPRFAFTKEEFCLHFYTLISG